MRERLAVSKKAAQYLEVHRFNLRKLRELEVKKHDRIKISNRLATLEKLNVSEGIQRAWINIKMYIKSPATESLGLHKLKQHKQSFDEEGSRF
jgi:hypothetical protein